jgi:hypothetical protein
MAYNATRAMSQRDTRYDNIARKSKESNSDRRHGTSDRSRSNARRNRITRYVEDLRRAHQSGPDPARSSPDSGMPSPRKCIGECGESARFIALLRRLLPSKSIQVSSRPPSRPIQAIAAVGGARRDFLIAILLSCRAEQQKRKTD